MCEVFRQSRWGWMRAVSAKLTTNVFVKCKPTTNVFVKRKLPTLVLVHQSATNVCAFAYVRRIRVVYTKGTTFSKGSLTFLVYARHVCMGCMRKVPLKKVVDLHAHWVYLQCMQKYGEPVQEPVLSTDSN